MAEAESAELAELRERLEVFGAFMGGIIIELDHEFRFTRIWTAHPELLAAPPNMLIGRTVREALSEREGDLVANAVKQLEATGAPVALDYSLDVQDGRRTFSAELRARGPRNYTMLIRDVTEAKELEGKLLQTERLAALGLLAASVGHEIRQPLSYVQASLEVMDREIAQLPLSERARTSLANIRSGSRRIAEIAASLDFLAGRRERIPAPFHVRTPIQAALDLCASELASVTLTRDLPILPRVRGDEGELCQVIANLVLNAVQASAQSITVRAQMSDGQVLVEVSDDGSGITPENLTQVFDPFFTTKTSGRGTGLGLFISKSIVEAQGGALRITSRPREGTKVEVLLPIAENVDGGAGPSSSVKPHIPRRRLKLLVVDDEPRFRESLRLALDSDHDVETSESSTEAIAQVEESPERYDLVLCDMAMAGVDGAAFFERMQARGIGDRFILMTGGAFTRRAADFIAAKHSRTITKPFLIDDLLLLMDKVAR